MTRFTMIVFAASVLLAETAYGASRYVDNSGSPSCSDSTSFGSQTQPWCTISYGISRISGGDDLFVKQGTYNEEPLIDGPAGSASKNTVIRTYPGHTVTIRGGGNSGRLRINATSYVTFDGFVVTNFNQGLFVDGGSDHITVQNCIVHDVGQEGIHVKEDSSFVTVQGCTIYNTAKLGGCCNGEGVYVGSSATATHDNTNNVTVRNNLIHDTTSEGIEIKPGTYNCVVEGNTLYTTNTQDHYAAIEINERDAGPQSWSGNPSHIVRNNVMHNNYNGIRLGTGSTAYNNVIYNTASGFSGIIADNLNGDNFTRFVYHNTVGHTAGAITISGATANVRNNIGSSLTNNLTYNAAYFINATAHDYHLVAGSAPVNVGANLTATVPTDIEGTSRSGSLPDLGAYEYASSTAPAPPVNLRIIP